MRNAAGFIAIFFSLSAYGQPNLSPFRASGKSDKIVVSTVSGTGTDATSIAPTDNLYIDWAFINQGTSSVQVRFYTELYVDGVLTQTWVTEPPLLSNYYVYVDDYALGRLSAGTHTLTIRADSTNAVAESTESDNEYSKSITVTDPSQGSRDSWILPSSAFRAGLNGAEFRTDVRVLNLGASPVMVTATFYDQASGASTSAPGFPVAGKSQASFDNVLQSLFGKGLGSGSFGPIRFTSTGPIVVSSSVNNVNACGTGATSGQWLPGIAEASASSWGAIPQLAVSTSSSVGYRTNLVFMNPGSASATATVRVRAGDGTLLSTGTIGPLGANGFRQVSLDSAGTFPGMGGTTDTNLWIEYTSDKPMLAFASVIDNRSGDPFAIVASAPTGVMSGDVILPSSAFRAGLNSAEFHTDVRILNLGSSAAIVSATLYDQASGMLTSAPAFSVPAHSQVAFDNALNSLFGKTLGNGSYGPIRFHSTAAILVSSSVNNVNACGTGAASGQWLPGLNTGNAIVAGAIPQLAVSVSPSTGYRSNLVIVNPGSATASVTVRVRAADGTLLSSGTIGPLGANGFSQVSLDSAGTFPGVAGRTDANLWVDYTSSQPVHAFASVIDNGSGDPFAVPATPVPSVEVPPLNLTGTFSGSNHDGAMSLTLKQTGGALSGYGTFALPYPYGVITVSVTGAVNGATVIMALQWNGGCYYKFPFVTITSATNDSIAGEYSAPLGCSGNNTGGTFLITRR